MQGAVDRAVTTATGQELGRLMTFPWRKDEFRHRANRPALPCATVVTGADSRPGIDRAVAAELPYAGWTVALAGRRTETLDETAALVPDHGVGGGSYERAGPVGRSSECSPETPAPMRVVVPARRRTPGLRRPVPPGPGEAGRAVYGPTLPTPRPLPRGTRVYDFAAFTPTPLVRGLRQSRPARTPVGHTRWRSRSARRQRQQPHLDERRPRGPRVPPPASIRRSGRSCRPPPAGRTGGPAAARST